MNLIGLLAMFFSALIGLVSKCSNGETDVLLKVCRCSIEIKFSEVLFTENIFVLYRSKNVEIEGRVSECFFEGNVCGRIRHSFGMQWNTLCDDSPYGVFNTFLPLGKLSDLASHLYFVPCIYMSNPHLNINCWGVTSVAGDDFKPGVLRIRKITPGVYGSYRDPSPLLQFQSLSRGFLASGLSFRQSVSFIPQAESEGSKKERGYRKHGGKHKLHLAFGLKIANKPWQYVVYGILDLFFSWLAFFLGMARIATARRQRHFMHGFSLIIAGTLFALHMGLVVLEALY